MAISEYVPVHGLLNAWQRINQESIWRFGQAAGQGAPIGACDVYIQSDREQIASALNQAFSLFATYLGYYPRPIWATEQVTIGGGHPFWWQQLRLPKGGYLIEFGQRATSIIQAGAPVVYSDADGDGVNDTATITVASDVDLDEAQIFFQVADGAFEAGDERYQIEPVRITRSGANIVIKGHRALFVKPATIWDVPFSPTDPNYRTRNYADTATATGFVTAVDVYRVYNDTASVGTLNGSHDTQTLVNGNLEIESGERGRFRFATPCVSSLDLGCLGYLRTVDVHFRAGYPLTYGEMDNDLLRGIIRLANANMYRKLCSFCPEAAEIWQQDRFMAGAPENPVATRHANNPFGLSKGHVAAWLTVLERTSPSGGAM